MNLTHGSLFSGIGGFDLAAEWMGWLNIFHCEKDSFCQKVLKYHFPNSIQYDDIRTTDFRKHRGQIDVLSGGFPCQPFSLAGQRKGATDDRYLWPQMLRAIDEIRPTWVIGENVGGIVSMVQPGSKIEVEGQASLFEENHKETLLEQEYVIETICQDLERIGYSVQPVIIPACAVGAPHRRDRVWLIANRTDTGIESLQRKRENGIYRSEIITDTDRNDAGRCRYGETGRAEGKDESKQEERERIWCKPERIGAEKITSNSECTGSGQILEEIQSGQPDGQSADGIGRKRTAPHAQSQQGEWVQPEQREISNSEKGKFRRSYSECGRTVNFREFPTQPPICSRNDGLSARLDSAALLDGRKPRQPWQAYGKWRNESVKAYGNAIVPHLAYEIYKAIELIQD